jgi:hypothetical protein
MIVHRIVQEGTSTTWPISRVAHVVPVAEAALHPDSGRSTAHRRSIAEEMGISP